VISIRDKRIIFIVIFLAIFLIYSFFEQFFVSLPIYKEGWFAEEGHNNIKWRWSGINSTIEFNSKKGRDYKISFDMASYKKERNIKLFFNSKLIYEGALTPSEKHFELSVNLKKGTNRLTFVSDSCDVPALIENSSDRRCLSFKLSNLVLPFSAPEITFLTPVFSDENIYLNMAKAVSNGLLPYKDFFYAHPPLQLFLFASMFKIFGANFIVAKIFITIIATLCLIFTYLISKEIFCKKSAIFSSIFFLIFPGFLIFGIQAMGMFEALLFFLIGFYFLLKGRIFFSSLFFLFSIFTRYMIIFLFPFIFFFLFKFKKKILFSFALTLTILLVASFLLMFAIFGKQFFIDTFLYHLRTNIKFQPTLANWIDQYLVLGFFTIFLSIFCITFSIFRKNPKLMIFSIYPLLYDLFILILLRQVIYHYFTLALPFLFIAVGETFTKSYSSLKFFLFVILFLSIFTNIKNLDLYFNKANNEVFDEMVEYTLQNTKEGDLIFGEPRSLNYISFVTNRKIVNNYFDSDFKFITFVGKEKILNEVDSKPKLVFVTEPYFCFFASNYEIVKEREKPGYYHLFLMRRV
jgi:uncharacterized membrane protein